MPRKKLTEIGVRRLKPPPPGKQVDYFDAYLPGLVLRVNYGGRKTWRALHYVRVPMTDIEIRKYDERKKKKAELDGREFKPKDGPRYHCEPRTHALGLYPVLDLKQARDKAKQFLADPQKALVQADTGSFRQVAENFVKRHVETKGLRTAPEIKRCLAKYIYPRWEHKPFRELRRTDVTALLDQIEDKHGKGQADYCLCVIRKMMNWYASRNDEYISPVVRGMGRRNIALTARDRTLDDEEIRMVWKACSDMGPFGALVKTLLLTAQRLRKVSNMRWDQLKNDEWHIPSEPREKGHAGVLKLPKLALDLINAQPRVAGNPFVFVAERGDGEAFSSFSHGKYLLNKKLPNSMKPWVLHDLRRTARSLLSRAGVRPDISERVLGHAIAGVEGVYDRHHYSQEKHDALTRLASLVETILDPKKGNVIAMQGRKGKRS
jgi:integrase